MTKNYYPASSSVTTDIPGTVEPEADKIDTKMTSVQRMQMSGDAVSPSSILTAADILKSHEDAIEERRRSHDGELHLPQSILTTIEVLGSPNNIRAQKLAANLAALEAKTNGNAKAATANTFALDRHALEAVSANPPSTNGVPKDGSAKPQHRVPGVLSYSKAAFDSTTSYSSRLHKPPGMVISSIISHADGKYDDINTQIIASVLQAHPGSRLIPVDLMNIDLFGFCFTGHAQFEMLSSVSEGTGISHFFFSPPPKRTGTGLSQGKVGQLPQYEVGEITYKGVRFTLYFATWTKGFEGFRRGYFVHDLDSTGDTVVEQLVLEAGMWTSTPKEQIWVFDQGYWQLDGALYGSIMKANWADIILPEDLKEDVLNDVLGFFAAEETYRGMRMPWKRGVVFYGPPGNGKTITLKAIMKNLYTPTPSNPTLPVPCLYVKTLAGWTPPEFSIRAIFEKAREQAPCFLIWEDLDSIINDANRSFFLNELDGLEDNNGILVIGTTNHLDRLDPGIIKRPSRFDRKYLFDNPDEDGRTAYVEYWRKKLADTPIDFTDDLVKDLVGMMKDFSFAYMKEAFVSTLLMLAGGRNNKDGDDKWAAKFESTIKKQIKQLREQLDAQ
ncbi:hypothetical protein H072_6336 [Dactylellina haptotyla CBS 200.50]|uniref:AAA+ ATPase domain-containing protein n=1 Tax=Dactylellina haptotyla (strain CBS 200.50) TaxID=1284197 RepID=S8AFL8_DACHA|nr:hypothetical protein H072_6336 [Dactylellina haptotyla CBS 200.50]